MRDSFNLFKSYHLLETLTFTFNTSSKNVGKHKYADNAMFGTVVYHQCRGRR